MQHEHQPAPQAPNSYSCRHVVISMSMTRCLHQGIARLRYKQFGTRATGRLGNHVHRQIRRSISPYRDDKISPPSISRRLVVGDTEIVGQDSPDQAMSLRIRLRKDVLSWDVSFTGFCFLLRVCSWDLFFNFFPWD
eukprot:g48687.t1